MTLWGKFKITSNPLNPCKHCSCGGENSVKAPTFLYDLGEAKIKEWLKINILIFGLGEIFMILTCFGGILKILVW